MTFSILPACPVCGAATKRHCNAKSCPWVRCTHPACFAVLDPATHRGYCMAGVRAWQVTW